MSVTIKFDAAAAAMRLRNTIESAMGSKKVKDQIISDCNKYCPTSVDGCGDGVLRKSAQTHSFVSSDSDGSTLHIVYSTPYARALYYGVQMVDPITLIAGFLTPNGWRSRRDVRKIPHPEGTEYIYHTPGTGKLWCETARNAYGEDWELIIQNAFREALK